MKKTTPQRNARLWC